MSNTASTASTTKTANGQAFLPVSLQHSSTEPLYRQLYRELRESILSGRIDAGQRLPPTRLLAQELHIARNTVVIAFEQLLAEGFLESRTGDGTYVSRILPDEMLHTAQRPRRSSSERGQNLTLSRRGAALAAIPVRPNVGGLPHAFRTGVPALAEFPFKVWDKLADRHAHRHDLMTYGDSGGYYPLREAVADYLRLARAVSCQPEQVVIVSGAQQAFDLIGRLLLDPGDEVWLEDPGYIAARLIMQSVGAQLNPIPVDDEGLDLASGIAHGVTPRLIYVTPSHQRPLGVTMSLTRRLALLDYANRVNAWIIEDDYDSEYRYSSRPLAALQGLDTSNRVIYVGTFSKVLFPALRLGYFVVPPTLIDVFINARAVLDRHSPLREQAIVADFITEGHFARHIRRMRALYAERQAILVHLAGPILGDLLTVPPMDAGMHLNGWLPVGVDDVEAARHAARYGLELSPLSQHSLGPGALSPGGFVLGYAFLDQPRLLDGLHKLARVLREFKRE